MRYLGSSRRRINPLAPLLTAGRSSTDCTCVLRTYSGRLDQNRLPNHPQSESRRGVLVMTRLFLFKPVFTTGAAIGALCAGAGIANAAGFSPNKPGFEHAGARRGDQLEPSEPLGCLVRKRKSRLDFGPGRTDEPAFFGYGQHGVSNSHCSRSTSRPWEPRARPGRSPTRLRFRASPRASTFRSRAEGMAPPPISSLPT